MGYWTIRGYANSRTGQLADACFCGYFENVAIKMNTKTQISTPTRKPKSTKISNAFLRILAAILLGLVADLIHELAIRELCSYRAMQHRFRLASTERRSIACISRVRRTPNNSSLYEAITSSSWHNRAKIVKHRRYCHQPGCASKRRVIAYVTLLFGWKLGFRRILDSL